MEELVKMIDGKAVTTSRKVAEVFEKQHKNVLQSIRELEIPEEYRKLNFQPTVYEQPNPSGGKPIKQPEYLITRDGFVLLTMGFTGKKAMEFKIAYIEAFNEMEEQLKNLAPCVQALPNRRDVAASTLELIDTLNRRILAGEEIDGEVLRYAWNIGKLIDRPLRRRLINTADGLEEFIMNFPGGRYSRDEVYRAYCASCTCPMSPRQFWPVVRSLRPCREQREAYKRFILF